jgi:hypothetical protein
MNYQHFPAAPMDAIIWSLTAVVLAMTPKNRRASPCL